MTKLRRLTGVGGQLFGSYKSNSILPSNEAAWEDINILGCKATRPLIGFGCGHTHRVSGHLPFLMVIIRLREEELLRFQSAMSKPATSKTREQLGNIKCAFAFLTRLLGAIRPL